jgi:acetyltransferase-like isoleucine patch superfamily enzyme
MSLLVSVELSKSSLQKIKTGGLLLVAGHEFGSGASVVFEAPVNFAGSSSMKGVIGAYTYVRPNCRLLPGLAGIGRYCSLATGVEIGDGEHPTDWLSTHPFQYGESWVAKRWSKLPPQAKPPRPPAKPKTIIGHDVWIGANAMIMRGVRIGHGAIIAGGAVVTKDVPPYAIVGGVPAKLIRYRFETDLVHRLLQLEWWRYTADSLAGIDFRDASTAISQILQRQAMDELELIPMTGVCVEGTGNVSFKSTEAFHATIDQWSKASAGLPMELKVAQEATT